MEIGVFIYYIINVTEVYMRVGGSMWMWYDLCHLRTLEADLRGRPEAIQRPQRLGFWLEISFLTTEMDGYWPNSRLWPRRSASDDLKRPQMTSSDIKRPNNWDFG